LFLLFDDAFDFFSSHDFDDLKRSELDSKNKFAKPREQCKCKMRDDEDGE